MSSDKIKQYYESTENRDIRTSLTRALAEVQGRFAAVTAIDCGCGAGRDIAFLQEQGCNVYAFDVEAESIRRCRERFNGVANVHLSQATFTDYDYPSAQLISADAALFFCPPGEFGLVWNKISEALVPGGIFVGSFLGERDTMASDAYDKEAYWPDVVTFTEASLRGYLSDFTVHHWQEHEMDGQTAQGEDHHWHIFELIAEKR